MKKLFIPVLIVCALAISAFTFSKHERNADEEAIEALILKSYVNGAFNALNPDEMRKGFHEDFSIFYPEGEGIRKYPIKEWADNTENKLMHGYDADDPKNKWEHKFVYVDVTGESAQVKIELHNQGKHIFTDYLSLLNFNGNWRIVAKVFHRHN